MISVTRRYAFPASHVLRHPALSDEENRRIYGKCANPNGHGHNYGIELTFRGPIDALTGRIVDLDLVDRTFDERVRARLSHTCLNDDAFFRARAPTAENLGQLVHEMMADAVASQGTARLMRVRIRETRKNSFVFGEVE